MEATRLEIRHLPGAVPQFQIVRGSDGKTAPNPVTVTAPSETIVEGSARDLASELRWYLERFLDYPYEPETTRAERLLSALRNWGERAFNALFGSREALAIFLPIASAGYEHLHLQISSDDPRVLAWPWEALRDPKVGELAQTCQIERRLHTVDDPPPLPDSLPKDRVNILLVTARPYSEDVGYRSISRPLLELIQEKQLPAQLTLLRPPTFDRLCEHLHERPGYYHIVHFDGHGGYDIDAESVTASASATPHQLRGPQGHLVFEKDDGTPDSIAAETLGLLLREHRIPVAVLNACQSAMVDARAEDAFASVAAALLRAGVRSVIAMAYSLYVSAAQHFLPDFYERLFETGDMAAGARAGRQQMYRHPERRCIRDTYPLHDWLVPVVYQHASSGIEFGQKTSTTTPQAVSASAAIEAPTAENPHGFIGRDSALLEIERAMRKPPAGVLIHGLGGIGKTTLARGFVKWLEATHGLHGPCIWMRFDEIRSASFVFNRIGEVLYGGQFAAQPEEQKLAMLVTGLRKVPALLVWDNFESVRGITETVPGKLSASDQQQLRELLTQLRGSKTKVLITSRSDEEWLGVTNRIKIDLRGLQHEERWEYAQAIVDDLNLRVDRNDKALKDLLDALEGHPLMMRVVLPRLEKETAAGLLKALKTNLAALGSVDDPLRAKLFATLRFVEEGLPDELRPLLVLLSLHERFAEVKFFAKMAEVVDPQWSADRVAKLFESLSNTGVIAPVVADVFELHPALVGYLCGGFSADDAAREPWTRAFVHVLGSLADTLASRELHELTRLLQIHSENFGASLREAERLGMIDYAAALLQSLAANAQYTRDFSTAELRYRGLAEIHEKRSDATSTAAALHQLGNIALMRRDFHQAETWYRKSIAILERLEIQRNIVPAYHQLGMLAEKRRDFDQAETWYRKSLAISEKLGMERNVASTYYQLGGIAEARRDFHQAETWYRKALTISENLGIEHGASLIYQQLGCIALALGDFHQAETWHRKSLAIYEKLTDEHGTAITYHNLGKNALRQGEFNQAEAWYRNALAIYEKQGDEHGAALSYGQLGILNQERGDIDHAETWYRKALAVLDKQGDEHGVAITLHQLGSTAQERGRLREAATSLLRALVVFSKFQDHHSHAIAVQTTKRVVEAMTVDDRIWMKAEWSKHGLGSWLFDDAAASASSA